MFESKGSAKTKASKRYAQQFGIEATIESLVETSKYSIDEIWLFSYELFVKEVTKFDMKAHAESKEMEAHYKALEAKNP